MISSQEYVLEMLRIENAVKYFTLEPSLSVDALLPVRPSVL